MTDTCTFHRALQRQTGNTLVLPSRKLLGYCLLATQTLVKLFDSNSVFFPLAGPCYICSALVCTFCQRWRGRNGATTT